LNTAEIETFCRRGSRTWSIKDDGTSDELSNYVLAEARNLAMRIGDDSNLTLDPDLDTYSCRTSSSRGSRLCSVSSAS